MSTSNPFSRMALNQGERPVSLDINILQSDTEASLMLLTQAILSAAGVLPTSGAAVFFGDGLLVTQAAVPGMTVVLNPGLGVLNNPSDEPTDIGGLDGVNDDAGGADVTALHPLPLINSQTLTIPANSSGSTRTDIIEVITDRRLADSQSRDVIDVSTGTSTPTAVNKELAYFLDGRTGTVAYNQQSTTGIGYKTGNPGAGAPTGSTGYTTIATITVLNGATSILNASIADNRTQAMGPPSDLAHMRLAAGAIALTIDGAAHKFNSFTTAGLTAGTGLTSDGTGKITANVKGTYRVASGFSAVAIATGAYSAAVAWKVYKNGTLLTGGQLADPQLLVTGTGDYPLNGAGELYVALNATDYLEIFYVATNTGGGPSVPVSDAQFSVQRAA
jgi:hypothetical protein